jgi:hypothetical protein
MRNDPVEEWRRLTEYYRSLTDDQLDELATEFADLTETARQILRAEVRSRGLPDPQAPHAAVNGNHASPLQPDLIFNAQKVLDAQKVPDAQKAGQVPSSAGDPRQEADLPHEYTWKTLLCTCNTRAEAWQISEMLRRAGIENWMDGPGVYSPHAALDLTNPRVLVAADELDRARVIASMPIPQDVIDESNVTVPDFELPACPGCGAADPVLESADPANLWRCESCGRRWTDPEDRPAEMPTAGSPRKN